MKLDDVYKKIDSLNETQTKELNEIASMNISMSGDTADDVGKLMQMMKLAGLNDAGPVGPEISSPTDCGKPVGGDMPVNPVPGDVEKFRAHQTDDPNIPGQDDVAGDQDLNAGPIGALIGAGLGAGAAKLGGLGTGATIGSGLAGAYVGDKATDDESLNASTQDDPRSELEKFRDIIDAGNSEETEDHGSNSDSFLTKIATSNDSHELIDQGMRGNHGPEIEQALQDMYNNVSAEHGLHPDDDHEAIYDRMADDIESGYGPKETDYANQPDEKYGDTKLMTKDLAGGLNGPKQSYPKVAGGDNPMSIRAELTRLENDIKGKLSAELKEKLSGDK